LGGSGNEVKKRLDIGKRACSKVLGKGYPALWEADYTKVSARPDQLYLKRGVGGKGRGSGYSKGKKRTCQKRGKDQSGDQGKRSGGRMPPSDKTKQLRRKKGLESHPPLKKKKESHCTPLWGRQRSAFIGIQIWECTMKGKPGSCHAEKKGGEENL